jgi:hypothetical protein
MTDSRQAAPAQGAAAQHEVHEDHGNSVAAWTGVAVIMLGFLVASIGVGMTSVWISIVGGVVVVLGAAAWKVLAALGYGTATR